MSALEPFTLRPDANFTMIGERTNVTGSKKFARLILSGDYETALEVARDQVSGGANVLDVNMDEGLLDSEKAMATFLHLVSSEPEIAKIPIMVDSSKFSVIEAGLACLQGKAVVNSISLKEGEEAFKAHARTVRRYGAAAVVMAFDETGQAVEVDHKVAIAERAYRILVEEVGFPPEDVIFDPNILQNGLLLRSDLHKLFDIGYLTVTPDYRVEVSARIKEEYKNGREYYAHHGQRLLVLPELTEDQPSKEFLEWHNQRLFVP